VILDESGNAARLSTPNFTKSYHLQSLLFDNEEDRGRFRHTLTKFKTKFNYELLIKDIYGDEIMKYHRPNNPHQREHDPQLKFYSEKTKFIRPVIKQITGNSQFKVRDNKTPIEDKGFYYK
jgi:hypothetical protein